MHVKTTKKNVINIACFALRQILLGQFGTRRKKYAFLVKMVRSGSTVPAYQKRLSVRMVPSSKTVCAWRSVKGTKYLLKIVARVCLDTSLTRLATIVSPWAARAVRGRCLRMERGVVFLAMYVQPR